MHGVVDCATQGSADLKKEGDIGGEVFNSRSITSYQLPMRQASKRKSKPIVSSMVPIIPEEDYFLRKCLRIYGFGKWTCRLHDPCF